MGHVVVFVLDSTTGRPAEALGVRLERRASGGGWATVAAGATRGSGEVPEIVAGSDGMVPGEYRLVYATGAYFQARGVTHFHGEVTVTFTAESADRFVLPLILGPHGYTTYRGS
jgi:5-hydroxyisourate hydrolase